MKKDVFKIENLVDRGMSAIVTNDGLVYKTYMKFAGAAGYPDAVYHGEELRNGEYVRILAIGDHEHASFGKIYVVETTDGVRFLIGTKGVELVHIKANFDKMPYDELIAHIEEAVQALRRRAYKEGYEQGKFDARIESEETVTAEICTTSEERLWSPQKDRDRIIEKAKRDVAWLLKERPLLVNDFYINREKRTVVSVLFRGIKRGIAKCAPDDCFNVHIGKAIALRRALGLEVPTEYLNAPQPEEPRVGDVVQSVSKLPKFYRVVDKIFTETNVGECSIDSVVAKNGKIIDDSRDE
ncbi:hypothetical protein WD019_02230 [Fictibacillus sp. Mic-4]|uniref:hypothetical protein n=1 Tax=Fictibacillus sp. Mic-4 TaxID=3132826 RepID=UPI003CF8C16F